MLRRLGCILLLVAGIVPAGAWGDSAFSLPRDPERPRNYWVPPLASYLLPGFDQWWEGQLPYAAGYSGFAAGGLLLSSRMTQLGALDPDLDSRDNRVRWLTLGTLMYSAGGGFSAYHAFRSAVRTRQTEFSFLTEEESPADLALAPFRVDYFARLTTVVPLATGVALMAGLVALADDVLVPSRFTLADGFFAGSYSYLAGSNEEAAFRGFLMPASRQIFYSDFWSNAATAFVFAAAHYSPENRVPLPQFVLGAYLGWLTQYRDWTLSEAIFVHAWWDVIVFTISYASYDKAELRVSPVVFRF